MLNMMNSDEQRGFVVLSSQEFRKMRILLFDSAVDLMCASGRFEAFERYGKYIDEKIRSDYLSTVKYCREHTEKAQRFIDKTRELII